MVIAIVVLVALVVILFIVLVTRRRHRSTYGERIESLERTRRWRRRR